MKDNLKTKVSDEAQSPAFLVGAVSGSASDFEKDLYKLINAYINAGLKKTYLVDKMKFVTKSCEMS